MSYFAAIKSRDVGTLRSLISPPSHHQPHYHPLGSPPLYGATSLSRSLNSETSLPIQMSSQKNGRFSHSGNASSAHLGSNDINARDTHGNTPLLTAVATGRIDLVKVLLDHPKLNVNVQDLESGYTALHKALFYGYLTMAVEIIRVRPDCDLSLRDKEGNTALDLLNACMKLHRIVPEVPHMVNNPSPNPSNLQSDEEVEDDDDNSDAESQSSDNTDDSNVPFSEKKSLNWLPPSMSCYMWGSNSNYVLGKSSTSESVKPERLVLKSQVPVSTDTFDEHDPEIVQVAMSKYHTCIVTPTKLYVQGFGPGGRLGLGNEETAMRPTEVSGIIGTIASIGVGPDHTLAITSSGDLWTWGNNEHAQLGYPIQDDSSRGPPKQLRPRQVVALKKARCIRAAGSKYHSVILTSSSAIYTWGENRGQLGYTNQQVQTLPRKVTSFPQQKVLDIQATNNATAILTAQHEVYVLCSGDIVKVNFPTLSPERPLRVRSLNTQATMSPLAKANVNTPIKIVSGNHQFGALMSNGDIYLWSPPAEKAFHDTWQQVYFPQKKPKRIWSMRKKHLTPKDFAIGIDSTIIIVTESGHVFRGTRRSQVVAEAPVYRSPHVRKASSVLEESSVAYFKYEKLPYLQHIQRAVASSSGAYAAIRSDHRVDEVSIQPRTMHSDFRRLLSCHNTPSSVLAPLASPQQSYSETLLNDVSDVSFIVGPQKCVITAHQIILAFAVPFFQWLFCGTNVTNIDGRKFQLPPWMQLEKDATNQLITIHLPETHPKAVSLLLDYIYSGSFKRLWSTNVAFQRQPSKKDSQTLEKSLSKLSLSPEQEQSLIYNGFMQLAKWLRLPGTELLRLSVETPTVEQVPPESYFARFKDSFEELKSFRCDVAVYLADDEMVYAHQVILAARSPFFDALIGPYSSWSVQSESGILFISLKHIRKEIFDIVLHFMYTDDDQNALFEDIERKSIREYIELVVEVLSVANELLLDRLKDLCSAILCRFMEVKHSLKTLELADTYHVLKLKDACLRFICWNLESFLEGGLLTESSLDPHLLADIERKLKDLQVLKFPRLRGPNGYYADIKYRAKKHEEEMKNKRRMEYLEKKRVSSGSGLLGTSEGGISFCSSHEPTPLLPPASYSASLQEELITSPLMLPTSLPPEPDSLSLSYSATQPSSQPVQTHADENIFDIELDDRVPPLESSRNHAPEGSRDPNQQALSSEDVNQSSKTSSRWNSSTRPQIETPQPQRVSLREIMTEQSSSSRSSAVSRVQRSPSLHAQASPRIPSTSSSLGSGAPFILDENIEAPIKLTVSTKLSQKQRRKSSKSSSTAPNSDLTVISSPTNAQQAASAWGTVAKNTASLSAPVTPVKSLKDIQEEEERKLFGRQQLSTTPTYRPSLLSPAMKRTSGPYHTPSPFIRGWAGWTSPSASGTLGASPVGSATDFPSLGSPATPTKKNSIKSPLGSLSSTKLGYDRPSPPMFGTSATPPSLLEIQVEQECQKAHRQKQMKKPLEQIQVEERAIQELHAFYEANQTRGAGEWVTIHAT